MTKEEIIEECRQRLGFETDYEMYSLCQHEKDFYNAIIKALEQQHSDDCVSRADLLKEYENRFIELQKAHQTDKQLGVNWCINTLKDMPSVTPTQRWIPVSERLPNPQKDGDPDYSEWVQVSVHVLKNFDIVCSAYYCFSESKWYSERWYMDRLVTGKVMAWQPLPKPYEEKRGSENGSN